MTYEENVKKTAERLAKERYAREFIDKLTHEQVELVWDRADKGLKVAYVKGKNDEATQRISEQAEAAKGAFTNFFGVSADDPHISRYLVIQGLTPGVEKQCDHKDCNYGICNISNEPICGCCGAYVNTVMTEDEKQQERQDIYDKADINTYRVRERTFFCYGIAIECDNGNGCKALGVCRHSLVKGK